jgi:hypothetical protein
VSTESTEHDKTRPAARSASTSRPRLPAAADPAAAATALATASTQALVATTDRRDGLAAVRTLARSPQVEIVVPVRNEQVDLPPSIRRLHAYLTDGFPFAARITIADNGSTDGTWATALALAAELPGVRAERPEQLGRGRALRAIWSHSGADVLASMDVDLSTDLNALLPLIAPLTSGRSGVAIGPRLARAVRVGGGRAAR